MKLRELFEKKPSEVVNDYLNSHEFKVGFAKVHQKLWKVRAIANAMLDNDPFVLLQQFGIYRTTKIHHGPFTGDRDVVFLDAENFDGNADTFLPGPVTVKVLQRIGKSPVRKAFSDAEPLGSEDFELGLRVPPAELDPAVQAVWYHHPELAMERGRVTLAEPPTKLDS